MTGTTRSSEGLDERRKRLLFRSWHRGTREMDLIMGRFADANIGALSDAELDAFGGPHRRAGTRALCLDYRRRPVAPEHDTALFHRLRDFARTGPK